MGLHWRETIARVLLDRAARLPAPDHRTTSTDRVTPPRPRLRFSGVALCMALAALVLSAAPASAAETHAFCATCSFGAPGPAAGDLTNPAGVAVDDATGDVYIADTGNDRIDQFEADGTFVRAWGWSVVPGGLGGFEMCGPGAIPSTACQKGESGSNPGEFETPVFIAVDNSGGPSEGAVYVGDTGDNLVTKFNSEGVLESAWGDTTPTPNGQLSGNKTTAGSFGALAGVAAGATGTLYTFDTANQLFEFEPGGTFIAPELPAGGRGTEQTGLAVDSLGDFFKVNGDQSVEKFTGSGGDVGQVSLKEEQGHSAIALATDGTDLYVAEHGAVSHYAFAEPVNQPGVVIEPGGSPCTIREEVPCPATDSFGSSEASGGGLTDGSGIGVDSATGDVFLAEAAAGRVDAFIPVDVSTGAATEIKPTSATLNGAIDPHGVNVTSCVFDYVPQAQFEAEKGAWTGVTAQEQAPCEQPVGSGTSAVSVTKKVSGLQVGTTYEVRLRDENEDGVTGLGEDKIFATQPPPAITAAKTANLSAGSVDLEAQVNPGALQVKSCVFEYGTEAGVYSKQLECSPPAGQIGAGRTAVPITQRLEGLTPNITYYWRVVASNEAGTTTGLAHTFIYPHTATGGAGGLPDHRAYEMVTPPHKNAALIGDLPFGGPPDVAENGEHVMATAAQCFAGAPSCVPLRGVSVIGVPYEFSRTAAGWVTTPLAPPASEFTEDTFFEYDADAGTALFSATTPPYGEDDFYAREPATATKEAEFVDIGPFTPHEDGPTSLFEIKELSDAGWEATGDLSHLVFGMYSQLWPVSKNPLAEPNGSLLEYTHTDNTEEPLLVGVSGPRLPDAESTDLIDACYTRLIHSGAGKGISADGRIVYFQATVPNGGCLGTGANAGRDVPVNELFARVDGGEAGAHTLAISEPQQSSPAEPDDECTEAECVEDIANTKTGNWREAKFAGSSNDGSKVFFSSVQRLTNDATEGSTNLYLYDMDSPVGSRLVDVSAGDTSGGGPRVASGEGAVALSSDGSHIYFVAQGVLAGSPNAEGHRAVAGANNLYMFERKCPGGETETECATHVQRSAFVATLPQSDHSEWESVGFPANVTPEGRFLLFTSHAALTSDTTRADGALQVYRYDAETGKLQRISIGERGFDDDGNAGAGNAQIVPGKRGHQHLGAGRSDPTMSDDGSRVFFMSPIALTAGALNDVVIGTQVNKLEGQEHTETAYAENVYEWEQPGAGSCSATEAAGCTFLISDGHDTSVAAPELCKPDISAVCLLGTDTEGKNVFFTTADQLVPQDTDTQLDYYDARICEPDATPANPCIAPEPPPLQACNEEACHGNPPERSALLTGGSETFNGAGNLAPTPPAVVKPKPLTKAQKLADALKACRRDKSKKKRVGCEKSAHRKYGAVKTKKSAKKSTHGKGSN